MSTLLKINSINRFEILINQSLNDVSFLSNVIKVQELSFISNQNLGICNYPIICKMLNEFPNSINLRSNLKSCTNNVELRKQCTVFKPNAIYPNPVSNKMYFSQTKPGMITSIEIYNLNGERVIQNITDQGYVIVSELSPGIYFVIVNSEDNEIQIRQKMIKL